MKMEDDSREKREKKPLAKQPKGEAKRRAEEDDKKEPSVEGNKSAKELVKKREKEKKNKNDKDKELEKLKKELELLKGPKRTAEEFGDKVGDLTAVSNKEKETQKENEKEKENKNDKDKELEKLRKQLALLKGPKRTTEEVEDIKVGEDRTPVPKNENENENEIEKEKKKLRKELEIIRLQKQIKAKKQAKKERERKEKESQRAQMRKQLEEIREKKRKEREEELRKELEIERLRHQVEEIKKKKEEDRKKKEEGDLRKELEILKLQNQLEEIKKKKEEERKKKEEEMRKRIEEEKEKLRVEMEKIKLRKELNALEKERQIAELQAQVAAKRAAEEEAKKRRKEAKLKEKEELEMRVKKKLEQELEYKRLKEEVEARIQEKEVRRLKRELDRMKELSGEDRLKEEKLAYLQKELKGGWEVDKSPPGWGSEGGWGRAEAAIFTQLRKGGRAGAIDMDRLIDDKFLEVQERRVTVRIKRLPFDQGALRLAYYMLINGSEQWVLKEFKKTWLGREEGPSRAMLHLQAVCQVMAEAYNEARAEADRRCGTRSKAFSFIDVAMIKLVDRTPPLYCTAERLLLGKYSKFNNNDGFTAKDCRTAQAFSHFTFRHSREKLMVVDLQGVKDTTSYKLTDPAIHSAAAPDRFGGTNLGHEGYLSFFRTHHCNPICQRLSLPMHPLQPRDQDMFETKIG